MSLCVGLTGGIGSGKSTVAKLFQQHGALIIDTDAISHQLTQTNGGAMSAILEIFGDSFTTQDGALDRAKMRNLIFADESSKRRLEDLLHPLILEQVHQQLQQPGQFLYVIMVVPLLLQSPGYLQLVQRVLVVDCDEQHQIERVMQRSGLSDKEVRAVMAQQSSREQRLAQAHEVIHNDGGIDELSRQVAVLHDLYSAMSRRNGD